MHSASTIALASLRFQIQRVLQSTMAYFADGLRAATERFHAVLLDVNHAQHPTNMPGYRSMHSAFVEGLQRFAMLSTSVKPQYRRLRELIRIALELPMVARAETPSAAAVSSLTQQFTEARSYILDSLVSMIHSADPPPVQSCVARWPVQSQWAKELLARIDPSSLSR